MVYMSIGQNQYEMSAQGQPLVFSEERGNPNITGQTEAGSKTS